MGRLEGQEQEQREDLSTLVDESKPLLPQVRMGAEGLHRCWSGERCGGRVAATAAAGKGKAAGHGCWVLLLLLVCR